MSYADRMAFRDTWGMRVKRAVSYLRSSRDGLYAEIDGMGTLELLPVEYWDLLDLTLETALAIVEKLPDDFFIDGEVADYFGLRASLGDYWPSKHNSSDGPFEQARKIVDTIERQTGRCVLRTVAGRDRAAVRR